MSDIGNLTTRLRSVNSILLLRIDGRLTFDEALVLSEFYRDYSDTNNIIETTEKEVVEEADRLLSDTFSLLSEIEKLLSIGVAGIQSVNFEQLFEQHVKPFEERYESAKAISTRLWQEYSAISNRLDFLPLDSDEYQTLNAECDAKNAEYDAAHAQTNRLYDMWQSECQRCFCVYCFKPMFLEVLVARLKGISESIIADMKHIKEEQR